MLVELYEPEVREVLDNPRSPLPVRLLLHCLTESNSEGICTTGRGGLRDLLRMFEADGTTSLPSGRRIERAVNLSMRDGVLAPGSRPGSLGLLIGRRVDTEAVTA